MTPVTVLTTMPVSDRGYWLPPTTLTYDPADPFAVTLVIGDGSDAVTWVFARDLLVAGMTTPAGICDIHIAPTNRRGIAVTLSSADGTLTFYLNRRDVADFLAASGPLVPDETDDPDIDVELALLLLEERAW